jgi:hypothetical protein
LYRKLLVCGTDERRPAAYVRKLTVCFTSRVIDERKQQ